VQMHTQIILEWFSIFEKMQCWKGKHILKNYFLTNTTSNSWGLYETSFPLQLWCMEALTI